MLDHLKNAPVRVSDMPPDSLRRYCAMRHEQHRDAWLRQRARPTLWQRLAASLAGASRTGTKAGSNG